jgi:hypothetical protein
MVGIQKEYDDSVIRRSPDLEEEFVQLIGARTQRISEGKRHSDIVVSQGTTNKISRGRGW